MARVLFFLACAAALIAGSACAASAQAAAPSIGPALLGGVPLGRSAAFYRSTLARPVQRAADDDGFDRLLFPDLRLALLFEPGRDAAVAAISWSPAAATAAGVGPCSPVTKLLAAYRGRLRKLGGSGAPAGAGGPAAAVAYRLGRLVFVAAGGRVAAVALLGRGVSVGPALTAPRCVPVGRPKS